VSKPFKFRYVNELTGVFVIVIVALLVVGVLFAGRAQRWFEPVYELRIVFPPEGTFGLQKGAEINILGTPVGTVDRIEVTEGELVELDLQATDPDGDIIIYTFSDPLDNDGQWQTKVGDAGEYRTVVVASDGMNEVSQEILISVLSSNRAPTLQLSDRVEVDEGDLIELEVEADDADGDEVSVQYSGFMESPTYRTTFDDAGEYTVTVTASDGTTEVSGDIIVIINNVNRAPILGSLEDVTVEEGELVNVNVIAADPDKDEVAVSFSALLNDNGQWQTEIGDAGTFEITVSASDGDLATEESFTLVVESSNRAPVIEGVPDEIEVEETETIEFDPVVTDADGDEVTVTYSGFMTSSSYTTTYSDGNDDPSEYTVLIIASDGVNQVSHEVSVKVYNKNRPPVFVI